MHWAIYLSTPPLEEQHPPKGDGPDSAKYR